MSQAHVLELNGQSWCLETFTSGGCCFGLAITEKVHDEQSDWQKIEVFKSTQFGHVMLLDGCMMVSEKDHFLYHEMMAHPAIGLHPNPKRVAIIGGGDGGVLTEVLKHQNLEHAKQIEIDEAVTRVSAVYFPELLGYLGHPKASLDFEDGIAWADQQAPNSWDVIIVDSTDPVGPAEGLFRESFYAACLKALGPKGVFVQQTESPLLHHESIIKPTAQKLQSVGFKQTQTLVFPKPLYPSGWWSCTLASAETDVTALPTGLPPEGLRYYSQAMHQAAKTLPAFFNR